MEYFLNKIADAVNGEGGDTPVSGGVLVVNITDADNGYIFDKTAEQVYSALTTTGCVAVYNGEVTQMLRGKRPVIGGYVFHVNLSYANMYQFNAGSGEDYPVAALK